MNQTDLNLEQQLFQPEKCRKKGIRALLNLNQLPSLCHNIKSLLSTTEISCLNEYELQNLLIEICYSQLRIARLSVLQDYLLNELRNNSRYWTPGSEVFLKLSAEKVQITDNHNLNGVDQYILYHSKVNDILMKYGFSKKNIDDNMVTDIENENNQEQFNDIEQKPLISQKEIFEKLMDLNDTQRLTRQQKKQLFGDKINSNELKKFIDETSLLQKKRKENEFNQSIFNISRFKKFPKIEFQVFPFIYNFLISREQTQLNQKQEFSLQNWLLFLLLQEKQHKRKFRINQNLFKDVESQTLLTLEEEGFIQTNEETQNLMENIENTTILKIFYDFCDKKGFLLENIFVSDQTVRQTQKTLLTNILTLSELYLTIIKNRSLLQLNNLNEELDYRDILENLDYETTPLSLSIQHELINFYLNEIEDLKEESHSETIYQYKKVLDNFKKCQIMGYFGTNEEFENIVQYYLQIFESPNMKKKRSYRFHTEERGAWTETMFKKFLEALEKFFDIPINNKKISKFVGGSARPNHVRFIKGKYMRRLKKRAKLLKISPKELLKLDKENFDMELFKEEKDKIAKKEENNNI